MPKGIPGSTNVQARKEYERKWQKDNADKIKTQRLIRQRAKRELIGRLKNAPCMDCKQLYPRYVMDFDHRDPQDKAHNVSYMFKQAFHITKILKEIAKCDLVCANCHRIRTWRRNHAD